MESQLKKTKEDAAVAQQQSANTQQQVETKMAEVSSRYKVIDELAKKFGRLNWAVMSDQAAGRTAGIIHV